MDQATIVLTAVATAIGVAVGKAWGSYGKQTTILCNLAQEACRGKLEEKMKALVERMHRIERRVLNNEGAHKE